MLALTPPAGSNPVGQASTITATVTDQEGRPLAGIPVTFSITTGPNAGATGTTDPADGRTDANGQVRFTYVGAGGPGTDTIVATARLASGVTIVAPGASVVWTVPTIALPLPPGPNLVGQAATITAIVTDTDGAPLVGIPVTFRITAGPDAAATGTTDPANGRTDAGGRVRFTYVGAGGPGTDTIVATARLAPGVTIAAPGASVVWTVPPTVVSLQRFGVHLHPTTLVLTFSTQMDAARARSLAEYHLVQVGPDHRTDTKDDRAIPIRSARYDAATETVTLRPIHRLPLRRTYMLTVLGMPPGGLTDTAGVFLDGAGTGRPGSDYVALIDRNSLGGDPERHKSGPGTGSGSAVKPRHKPSGDSTQHARKATPKGLESRPVGED
jgi:hypothetical protein